MTFHVYFSTTLSLSFLSMSLSLLRIYVSLQRMLTWLHSPTPS